MPLTANGKSFAPLKQKMAKLAGLFTFYAVYSDG